MVAEVCLGKVGAVAAREVSRFARNSRDWQQLIEMCRVVDTVLIDQEAVYAPRQGNDRLLLGLKGSLNEYELDLLRHRSLSARYEKARRGELIAAAPVGFLIRDRDRIYGSVVTRRLRAKGIRDKPTAPASPWQNGFAERLIGSIRGECVDHIIVLGEMHLRRVLQSYARYYNILRTHRSLDKDAPVSRQIQRIGSIKSHAILGGRVGVWRGRR